LSKISRKVKLAPAIKLFELEVPFIAEKALPGHFIVVRAYEEGERIPLTIADSKKDKGTITIIIQEVGTSTKKLGLFSEGDEIIDVIGPLGKPSHIDKFGTVVMIGGGVGIAPAYPITKAMKQAGNKVISIIGARNKELLFFEDEIRNVSDKLFVTTDDGSYGTKGFVSDVLQALINKGSKIDRVVAIGPTIMMKVVCDVTRPYNIPTIVSLNPIMVDGTGMCGACRVEVGGETKFTCVDGPEFDGHKVDFDLLMKRQRIYLREEEESLKLFEKSHKRH
jgi:NAD(P)H-flavin reductase